ncbi:MAG: family 1 extracellular solute-binding protein, partial [Paenibacillaceae bacterium]|nr:family 1 extracellular solute-binding protein [Paenibacillaceae bacterium]
NLSGGYQKDDFENYFAEPAHKKFPYISFEYFVPAKGEGLPQMVAANHVPDIMMAGVRSIDGAKTWGIPLDLRELIKKDGLDLNVYDDIAMDTIKNYGDKGEVYALPTALNYYLTLYNKNIFDKFATPYPHDLMTWREMFELGKRVTREEGSVQYKGLQPSQVASLMARGMSLSFVDPKTNRAKITTDPWVNLFRLAKEIYTSPGNEPAAVPFWKEENAFMEDKNIAMVAVYGVALNKIIPISANLGFDWDVTTFPAFEETRGTSAETDPSTYLVSSMSKYPEDAFLVIKYLTTDPELQLDIARRGGNLPALKTERALEVLGANSPILKTKNLKGIFKASLRKLHPFSEYDETVRAVAENGFVAWLKSNDDANTVLRKLEEQANQKIDVMMK